MYYYKIMKESSSTLFLFWIFLMLERNKIDLVETQGSPINPYNLKLISIHNCRQCVIMSTLDRGNLDTYLVDKSSVLCALSIRQIQLKQAGLLSQYSLTGKGKAGQNMTAIMPICQNRIQTLTALSNLQVFFFTNYSIHFLFLAIDSSVQYVEQGGMTHFF